VTSATTAFIPIAWPSTAGRESPSEDEPGGLGPPRQSNGADAGPAAPPPSWRLRPLVTLRYTSLSQQVMDHCCASAWSLSCARSATWRQARGNSGTSTFHEAGHSSCDAGELSVTDK
jgi:hypothetical protein